jgi:hypothetical protein
MSIKQALETVGYRSSAKRGTASAVWRRIEGRLAAALEELGFSDRLFAAKLLSMVDCDTLKVVHGPTGDVRIVADNKAQIEALKLLAKVRGDILPTAGDSFERQTERVTITERRRHQNLVIDRVREWTRTERQA